MTTLPSPSPTNPPKLQDGAGVGYRREWALFCDYTAATDLPTLPTSVDALLGFLRDLPAAPATTARRIRAIAAAHRRAGHLLDRPATDPAAGVARRRRPGPPDPGALLATCPTRGWPHGLRGRRDGFLIVLLEHLELTPTQARELRPADIAAGPGHVDDGRDSDGEVLAIHGTVVPSCDDTRECARCAVVRWLDVLSDLDGLGRGSARMTLTAAHAPTANSPHRHLPVSPPRWARAAQLLPAIDRHGWHDDYRPLTPRAIRARLAAAGVRATQTSIEPAGHEPGAAPESHPPGQWTPAPRTRDRDLDEVLGILDDLTDDADALNARIEALLAPPVTDPMATNLAQSHGGRHLSWPAQTGATAGGHTESQRAGPR